MSRVEEKNARAEHHDDITLHSEYQDIRWVKASKCQKEQGPKNRYQNWKRSSNLQQYISSDVAKQTKEIKNFRCYEGNT